MNKNRLLIYISLLVGTVLFLTVSCNNITEPVGSSDNASQSVLSDQSEETSELDVEVMLMSNGRGVACTEINTLTEENLKKLKDNGITFVKVHVPYPFDAAGNLSSSYLAVKKIVKRIHSSGLDVLCQSFTPGGNAYNPSTKKIEWMSYLPNVFEDYDDEYFYLTVEEGCKYIAKDLADYADAWLISNEPNIPVFTGSMTQKQIVAFLNTGAKGIKKGNPKAYCGVNIFGSANPQESKRLVSALYNDECEMDFLGLDSYFGTLVQGGPEDWDNYIDTYYSLANVPIIITEFSYSSYVYDAELQKDSSKGLQYNSNVCRTKKFSFEWEGHVRSEDTQAEYARVCMEIFSQHPEVIGSLWFCNIDSENPCYECGDKHCPMVSSWGLLDTSGNPKKVLQVLKEFSQNE